ncbi:hypothetical protein Tco_0485487 [Tanacetum coccineum]
MYRRKRDLYCEYLPGPCENHDLSRLDNQPFKRDRLIGIGFVLNFVKFISFTFGDKEMISVIEAIIREVFVKLLLDSFGKLSISMSPPIRRKYHDSVAFATGCKKIKKCRRGNRKIRIPIAMWPCRVEEKMTLKEVDGQTRNGSFKFTDMPLVNNALAGFHGVNEAGRVRVGTVRMNVETLMEEEDVHDVFPKQVESYLDVEGIKWVLHYNAEALSETDCGEPQYHWEKENVVVESWSRKKSEAKNEFWIDVKKSMAEYEEGCS